LITGGGGQLGPGLARILRQSYGRENVILTDVRKPNNPEAFNGPFKYADVRDYRGLERIIVEDNIDWVVNFAALLSAISEKMLELAYEVNVGGSKNMLDLERVHNLRVFIPSTIGAFGPSSQLKSTTGVPDDDKQRPTSFYGIHKVFLEHLGENYLRKWGVDFRCLRYPGIISADTEPGGGTTDYAVDIFKSAVKNEPYTCYLKPDSNTTMMHVDDCLKATKDFLETPSEVLDQVPGKRTYNVAAMSFTPKSISQVIRQHYPDFQVKYDVDPVRQAIADSWPQKFDDSSAREVWGWDHHYDEELLTEYMIENLGGKKMENVFKEELRL
jgi:threonine 3-dehydrogenase